MNMRQKFEYLLGGFGYVKVQDKKYKASKICIKANSFSFAEKPSENGKEEYGD